MRVHRPTHPLTDPIFGGSLGRPPPVAVMDGCHPMPDVRDERGADMGSRVVAVLPDQRAIVDGSASLPRCPAGRFRRTLLSRSLLSCPCCFPCWPRAVRN